MSVAANGDERLFGWLVTGHVVRKNGVGCARTESTRVKTRQDAGV
jgi:hypothetical protein